MKADFILALGTFLIFGLCALHIKAEVKVRSSSPSIGQRSSFATRIEHADSKFSPSSSAVSEARLFKRAKHWTVADEELLLELRKQRIPWSEMEEYFPGRSWSALQQKYYVLINKAGKRPNAKSTGWTTAEEDLLFVLVKANRSWTQIGSYFPGRNGKQAYEHYRYITKGRSAPRKVHKKWTTEEEELLMRLAKENVPWEERVAYFEDRGLSALKSRYYKLASNVVDLRRYQPEEIRTLIDSLEKGKTVEEIARFLDRSVKSVKLRIRKLEKENKLEPVPQVAKNRHYSDADYELMGILREQGVTWKDIARNHFPGRPQGSIGITYNRHLRRKKKKEEREKGKD